MATEKKEAYLMPLNLCNEFEQAMIDLWKKSKIGTEGCIVYCSIDFLNCIDVAKGVPDDGMFRILPGFIIKLQLERRVKNCWEIFNNKTGEVIAYGYQKNS